MQLDPHAIHIYTDGSCYKNPGGISGCAAIVHYPDHLAHEDEQIVDFGCAESNNNRMELLACICALEWIRKNHRWRGIARVQIVTDSQYVKDGTSRAREWKRNGWRNQHGEPRENWDLWNRLLSAHSKAGITVHFHQTPGKKSPLLKRIDKAAKAAASRGGQDVDRGFKPGTIARSMVKGSATRFPAKGQSVVIRPYRKTVMAGGENKVRFDLLDESTQTYLQSYYAYATPEMATELHRQHGYRVQFNNDPKYPQVLTIIEEVPLPKTTRAGSKAREENRLPRYYFAYGSNMDKEQMVHRCPDSKLVGTASVVGYKFLINERGVASMALAPDRTVYGLLWDVAENDEKRLDRYEGVAAGFYRKESLQVQREDGTSTEALVYIASSNNVGSPRPGYMEKILRAAHGLGFPNGYIEELNSWLSRTSQTG